MSFLKVCWCSTILLCVGCQPRPINLTEAKNSVQAYYDSGKFDWEFEQVIERAKKHFSRVPNVFKPTVIFDVDDTILSDYCKMKDIEFGYIPKLSHEWVLQADTCVIKYSKKLYDFLRAKGYTIIFLTGRKHDEDVATIKNLTAVGITGFERLIVRSQEEEKLLASEYKLERRKQLTEQGYTIVGSVGDQWSDMSGGYTGYAVKVPNYTYILY